MIESPQNLNKDTSESGKNYRIEHLPGFDVVVNLDYSDKEEARELLEIIKRNPMGQDFSASNSWQNLLQFKLEGSDRFFVKTKKADYIKWQVDFIRDRTAADPLNDESKKDFDKESRNARVGVMNEILLSKKIKEIVCSKEAQDIAKKYGFTVIEYNEPILAIIYKGENDKSLIYKKIDGEQSLEWIRRNFHSNLSKIKNLTLDFRELFFKNNIYPHDLKDRQFLIVEKDGKPAIVLIDAEAYTEIDKKDS